VIHDVEKGPGSCEIIADIAAGRRMVRVHSIVMAAAIFTDFNPNRPA
jgi:hypothetical protein